MKDVKKSRDCRLEKVTLDCVYTVSGKMPLLKMTIDGGAETLIFPPRV